MVEGKQGRRETSSFASLVRRQGGGVSGLLLRDGAVFDPAGSLGLFLPWGDDHMSRELARAGDLREIVAGEAGEKGPGSGSSRASSCSPSREKLKKKSERLIAIDLFGKESIEGNGTTARPSAASCGGVWTSPFA